MRLGNVGKIKALRHRYMDSIMIQLNENLFSLIDSLRKHVIQ